MSRFTQLLFLSVLAIAGYWACTREPVPVTPPTPDVIVTPKGDTIYIINTDTIYINTPGSSHVCSPDTVYFEQQLLPMIQSNCASPGCHDNVTHAEGIWLSSYEQILVTGGIRLNSPSSSKLYTVTNPSSGDRMPPSPRPVLTAAQRALLLKWIQQGAKNLRCDAGCDTTKFTYAAAIQPILALRCNGCHSNALASAGVNYSTYAGVKTTVDNGRLLKSINHTAGVLPMPYPPGSAKIPDCERIKIKKWIAAGAQNN